MPNSNPSPRSIRFGDFEVNIAAGELRKNGTKIKLQDQPFRVLTALLARPDEVVTREELRTELWPDDTYVDFDRSLNTAVNKLREAIGDSASRPKLIETLPRRGYRFLGRVDESPASDGRPNLTAPENEASDDAALARTQRQLRLALVACAALGLILTVVVSATFWLDRPQPGTEARLRKFSIRPPLALRPGPSGSSAAISPDGTRIVFTSHAEDPVWVRDLDRAKPRVIEGMERARHIFWSPDSNFIGFLTRRDVRKIAVQGGPSTVVCSLPEGLPRGGTWSPDGSSIVFSAGNPSRLYEAPALGGEPKLLVEPEEDEQDSHFRSPHFVRSGEEGRLLLYSVTAGEEIQLVARNLNTGATVPLAMGDLPSYSSGHIVYQTSPDEPGLWAMPFSGETFKSRGEPFSIAGNGRLPSVADDGTLVYLDVPGLTETRLFWVDRQGRKLGEIATSYRGIGEPQLSPDGSRVAFASDGPGDIYVHHLVRQITTRLSATPEDESRPAWSATGKEVAFSRSFNDLFIRAADGSAEEQILFDAPVRVVMNDWSRDGKNIAYGALDAVNKQDLWYLRRKPDGAWESFPFLQAPFNQAAARFSPDGRFIAYCSDESGRHEVYVRPFPAGQGRWQISNNGGKAPRWSRDGTELFYVEGDVMMTVAVTSGPSFRAGRAERLFQHSDIGASASTFARYDVSLDGRRFLVMEPFGDQPETSIRVVQNWYEEFRKKKTEP